LSCLVQVTAAKRSITPVHLETLAGDREAVLRRNPLDWQTWYSYSTVLSFLRQNHCAERKDSQRWHCLGHTKHSSHPHFFGPTS